MTKTDLTVAILAGGNSARFKSEKSLAKFKGRPLVSHMIDIADRISKKVLVVVSNEEKGQTLQDYVGGARIVSDPEGAIRCALTGALTAFEYTDTDYVLLLPVDTPLASISLLKTLHQLCQGHGAVVPSWPSGYIEPLHSVYLSEHAYSQGLQVIDEGRYRMKDLLDRMRNVLYVSTMILEKFDPNLATFSNANTERELRALEKSYQD
ncbi:MAG: molybdenum cofactor guanylyltransferase [Candidatus Thorarchaeota archaeon]